MKSIFAFLLIPALLLASCNSNVAPPSSQLPVATKTASGTVVEGKFDSQNGQVILRTSAWTGGAGSVVFAARSAQDGSVALGRTPLGADGKFSFATLADPKDSDLQKIAVSSENCSNTFVISDPAALNTTAAFYAEAQKSGWFESAALNVSSDGDLTVTTGVLIYADRAVTVKGMETCKQQDSSLLTADFDLTLVRGWNSTTGTIKAGSSVVAVRNGSPAGVQWIYFAPDSELASLSLNNFFLR
ncbi:hypothetical protein [Deinococcus marmoris]|uniref:hypothetical protein n=1 Tax=Deinococcus marmoris TaxID=249408 RepID=UPI0012DD0D6E|nr:hypothetical protein [Deinococcus marmoris]